jgi:hypothetical protein
MPSGECEDQAVLSIYSTQSDVHTVVTTLKELSARIGGVTLLVGKNWIINTPHPAKWHKLLGGTVVTS